jgi:hypothetical protein
MTTENLPSLTTAANQLQQIETAVKRGDYGTLQGLLLQQSVVLHELGMDFVNRSGQQDSYRHKRTCLDLALRAFNLSRKTMESIKSLEQ